MLLGSSRSNKDRLIVDLSKKKWQKVQKQKNMVFAQLLSVKFANNQDFGFVYIRETPTFSDVDKIFKDIKDLDVVMGDFNLNMEKDEDKRKMDKFLTNKERILHELTTARNNQLDHILISKGIKQDQ